jgi:hypothetical protein
LEERSRIVGTGRGRDALLFRRDFGHPSVNVAAGFLLLLGGNDVAVVVIIIALGVVVIRLVISKLSDYSIRCSRKISRLSGDLS